MNTNGPSLWDHSGQDGFSLVEVLVATLVLMVGLLGVVMTVDAANRATRLSKAREAGTSLARQLTEGSRAIPFPQLTSAGLASDLQAQPGLGALPGGGGYAIKRRGFTFSVDASVCALDDPRDGVGSHASGNFCRGGATALGDGSDCTGAIAAAGSAGVDVNGNKLDASLCATVDGTLVWTACDLLNTTLAAQASGSLGVILTGILAGEAQAAASATVCGHGAAAAADTDPEDYKRVVISARWHGQRVQQTALIANPGTAGGPAVTALSLVGRASTTVTDNPSSLQFSVTPSMAPTAVSWSRDGDPQGTATGSGTSDWSFVWDIGSAAAAGSVLDGTYLIGALALDRYGVSGPGRDVSVTLNRSLPRAPSGVAAGRSRGGVDIEWQANPERDVVGYRVYRRVGSDSAVVICTLTTSTGCHDDSPPNVLIVDYWVVGLDRDSAGAPRAGDPSQIQHVTQTNQPPNPPGSVTATTSGGATVLSWTGATDPDLGDSIDFFRIYRDGMALTDRYDRTGLGSDHSWTDTATGGITHQYWISAVDTQLGESVLVGPVTL